MSFVDRLRKSNGAAKNSILLTFVHAISTALGIIVTKLLSVSFSLQEYGTYSQTLLVTSTVTSISILGLTNATNYFYNRTSEQDGQKAYISTIFSIQYLVGLICAILVFTLRVPIARYFGNDSLVGILPIVVFTPLLTNLISMYQVLIVSIGKAQVIAIRNLIVSLIRLFAVIVACFVFNDIVIVLGIILFLDIAQVIYFYVIFKNYKHGISIKDCQIRLIKEILSFSIPMSIYILTNAMSRNIDKYVISTFSNTETLAIYTNAAKLLPFDMLTSSLITILVPIITRMINQKQYDEAKNLFTLYLRIGYIVTFIFVGGAVFTSRNLMLFLYDEKYLAGLPVFIVYLVVDMIRFANITTILSASGKTKTLMMISITFMLLNGVFNILGYRILGMIGPALVTLVLTVAMTIVLLRCGAKEIRSRIVDLFDFKELTVICVQICFVGFLAFMLSNNLHGNNVSYFVSLIICYGGYIVILGSLNFRRFLECYRKLNQYK